MEGKADLKFSQRDRNRDQNILALASDVFLKK